MGGAALDATWALPATRWEELGGSRGPAVALSPSRRPPVNETVDEVALVTAARDGDRDAFGRLYRHYGRMVHGVLLARVPRGQVEDLVQDVFLLALRRLDSLREPARFGGWLAMIARNRATDFHRRSRDTVELTEELPGPQKGADAEALTVLALLRGLPEAYRETLVLRLVEGMTGPEIAARMGMTEGSVRVNLHRGMKLLRTKMGVVNADA
jgi:RNA polymerase sigma-70 factor (ECF subfamily)